MQMESFIAPLSGLKTMIDMKQLQKCILSQTCRESISSKACSGFLALRHDHDLAVAEFQQLGQVLHCIGELHPGYHFGLPRA